MFNNLEEEQHVMIRDSLSDDREDVQLNDVLTARNDLDNEDEGL
jgi:hypothetical protein